LPQLRDRDLPALYLAADQSSTKAQQRFLLATRVRLGGLLGAAFFGLFVWTSGSSPVDWAGVSAAACFGIAVLAEVYLLTTKPERTWYEGRAAAESAKTLFWRYVMASEPFARGLASATVDDRFVHQLSEVLGVLKDLDLVVDDTVGEQITDAMRQLRSASLEERKVVYEQERVCQQQKWYSSKAVWNRRRARQWTAAVLLFEGLGMVAALLKAVGTTKDDFLGFASAIVATMTAWLQTKQHQNLATAYAVTALELASVRSRIANQCTENDWATFVADAEEAFSREHTLWKASRGLRSL
jgi:conflict system pore-forming effector with SLATT domain